MYDVHVLHDEHWIGANSGSDVNGDEAVGDGGLVFIPGALVVLFPEFVAIGDDRGAGEEFSGALRHFKALYGGEAKVVIVDDCGGGFLWELLAHGDGLLWVWVVFGYLFRFKWTWLNLVGAERLDPVD